MSGEFGSNRMHGDLLARILMLEGKVALVELELKIQPVTGLRGPKRKYVLTGRRIC